MDETTARQLLGLSADASDEEIRQAFRDKTHEEHPDTSDDPEATERFKNIKQARDLLLDSDSGASSTAGSQSSRSSTRSSSSSDSGSRSSQSSGGRSRTSTSSSTSKTGRGHSQTSTDRTGSNGQRTASDSTKNRYEQARKERRKQRSQSSPESQSSKSRYEQAKEKRRKRKSRSNTGSTRSTKTAQSRSNTSTSNTKGTVRGHSFPRWKLAQEDYIILGLAIFAIAMSGLVGYMMPDNPGGQELFLLLPWLIPSAYLGYRLMEDEIDRSDASLPYGLNYKQNPFLPAVGLLAGVVAALGIWFVLEMVFEIAEGSSVFEEYARSVGFWTTANALATTWASVVGLASAAVAFVTDGQQPVQQTNQTVRSQQSTSE